MWLWIYLISTVVFIYSLLMGDSNFHRNGIIGKLNRLITVYGPSYASHLGASIFPRRIVDMCIGCKSYCIDQKNPFLMIFYLLLVIGGYSVHLVTVTPLIPGTLVKNWHWYSLFVSVVWDLAWYYHVCTSDPGTITKHNNEKRLKEYDYDNQLYFPKKCKTCDIIRPARSKHCSICNRCVSRFDHHCPWINTDVGRDNLWKFLLFLFNTGCICLYAGYIAYLALYGIILDKNLLNVVITNPHTQMQEQLSKFMIFQIMMHHFTGAMAIGMFTTFMGIVLFLFLAYHIYLVINNTTTVETFKWSDLHDAFRRYKSERIKVVIPDIGYPTNKKQQKSSNKSKPKNQPKNTDSSENTIEIFIQKEDVQNTYNKGMIENFKEILPPL
eukprot:TRINITY_DN10931_c0_g1_i1.p1 TRINITY_DN10931_c0_g1~~TRINITY_DN10931_c0_g1_i1.p1  ORF type:complete len:383 (+),score=43.55 TRINITY_DN10931_c0_g1_i1:29-1177(+)